MTATDDGWRPVGPNPHIQGAHMKGDKQGKQEPGGIAVGSDHSEQDGSVVGEGDAVVGGSVGNEEDIGGEKTAAVAEIGGAIETPAKMRVMSFVVVAAAAVVRAEE